jgi:hypothetical protein
MIIFKKIGRENTVNKNKKTTTTGGDHKQCGAPFEVDILCSDGHQWYPDHDWPPTNDKIDNDQTGKSLHKIEGHQQDCTDDLAVDNKT